MITPKTLVTGATGMTGSYTVRVLLMVPVYSAASWLGLYQKQYGAYWDLARETYEAVAIYSFYQFLMCYLQRNAPELLAEKYRRKGKKVQNPHHDAIHQAAMDETHPDHQKFLEEPEHFFPCCCMQQWHRATNFDSCTKYGTLQYVPIKIVCAILTFAFSLAGPQYYASGTFAVANSYPYIALVTNCSQLWAMYCLVMYLHGNFHAFSKIQPVAKLLCIKGVVFFTFWQSVAIAGLAHIGEVHETQTYTTDQVSDGLQDFIVCIEMFIAALAHLYAFHWKEFSQEGHKLEKEVFSQMQGVQGVEMTVRSISCTPEVAPAIASGAPATAAAAAPSQIVVQPAPASPEPAAAAELAPAADSAPAAEAAGPSAAQLVAQAAAGDIVFDKDIGAD